MPSQPSSLPSKSKNNTTITTTTIIRQPPSTATPRLRDQLIRVQLELMSDMAVDVALSPRIDGSNNNSLTSNNSTVDFSTADAAAAASPSKISQHNDEIGIVGATNNVGRSPTDDNYANNNYDGSGPNNNNSSGTSPSSPLFGSIPNCIPNAARAIASMLSGTVARVTHEQQQQQQHANNHDDIESSATAAKVVSEVMYANNLLSSGNVDDYYCDQNITAAVSDVTNAAAAAAASSSSSNSNHINDATGEESSSNNDYPQKNDSSSTTVSHVVVSLDDDHYKEIMWKHFRILGKSRDIELSKVGNEILVEFKQQMSSNGGRFYRRERGQEIEIDDDKALCSEYTLPILSITVAFQMFSDLRNSCAHFFCFNLLVYYLYIIIQRLTLTLADE